MKPFDQWLAENFPELASRYVGPGDFRERERMRAAWGAATERAANVVDEYKPFDHGTCQCFSCNRKPLTAAILKLGENDA